MARLNWHVFVLDISIFSSKCCKGTRSLLIEGPNESDHLWITSISSVKMTFNPTSNCMACKTLSLTFCHHALNVAGKASARVCLLSRLCGHDWGVGFTTLRSTALTLIYASAK
ncbi:uncharacterized protein [Diadema antillarum]|uniref:uncharacterized protein n=1 Tax=Diadema antillarum TaxID=105358 RepID=UPI003A871355